MHTTSDTRLLLRCHLILARCASTETQDTQSWAQQIIGSSAARLPGGHHTARMGSKRSTEDPAADAAAADAEAGPGHAAAAADQPSSSGQQFVNAGVVPQFPDQQVST